MNNDLKVRLDNFIQKQRLAHKYIFKIPDEKGGFKYIYPKDIADTWDEFEINYEIGQNKEIISNKNKSYTERKEAEEKIKGLEYALALKKKDVKY